MKRMALFIMVGVIVSGLPGFVSGGGGPVKGHPAGLTNMPAAKRVLGVDQFMTSVSRYRGPVLIEGVVSGVFPRNRMVALIDTNEFKACGVTTCAKLTLPIQWTGQMPRIQDTVRVAGQVQQLKGKLVFVGQRLTRIDSKKRGF
jgi:hypothetical protein